MDLSTNLVHLAPLAAGRSQMRMFNVGFALSHRHARPWAGHPRLALCRFVRRGWPGLRHAEGGFGPAGGTSPAMTMPKQRLHSGHSSYAIALPQAGRGEPNQPSRELPNVIRP